MLTVWAGGPGRVPAQSALVRVGDHKHVGAASVRAGGLLGVGGRSLLLLLGIWNLLLLLLLWIVVMLLLRVPRVLELNNFDIISLYAHSFHIFGESQGTRRRFQQGEGSK